MLNSKTAGNLNKLCSKFEIDISKNVLSDFVLPNVSYLKIF